MVVHNKWEDVRSGDVVISCEIVMRDGAMLRWSRRFSYLEVSYSVDAKRLIEQAQADGESILLRMKEAYDALHSGH